MNRQRLELLIVKRRAGVTVFVDADGPGAQVTLPRAWTDRGVPAGELRVLSCQLGGLEEVLMGALLEQGRRCGKACVDVEARCLARGSKAETEVVLAQISAINTELLARRKLG